MGTKNKNQFCNIQSKYFSNASRTFACSVALNIGRYILMRILLLSSPLRDEKEGALVSFILMLVEHARSNVPQALLEENESIPGNLLRRITVSREDEILLGFILFLAFFNLRQTSTYIYDTGRVSPLRTVLFLKFIEI